jgi:single-strand DNA-binding protein
LYNNKEYAAMSKDLNKVQLIGRLGADPEMRYTQQGNAVTNFRVASSRTWKKADGTNEEETEWFKIVAWNKLGEICGEYLRKGARVYIEGRLKTRSWQDDSGQTRYMTEVIAEDLIMLDSRRDAQANSDFGDSDVPYDAEPEPAAPRAGNRSFANDAPSRGFQSDTPRRAPANGNAPARQPARPSATMDRPRRPVAPADEPMDDEDLPF